MDGVNYTHETVIHDVNFVNPDIHSKYREYVDERETKTTSTIWNVQGTASDIPFRISMEQLLPE
jgi:hypothetical protein